MSEEMKWWNWILVVAGILAVTKLIWTGSF